MQEMERAEEQRLEEQSVVLAGMTEREQVVYLAAQTYDTVS